jgi:hypothetical protein
MGGWCSAPDTRESIEELREWERLDMNVIRKEILVGPILGWFTDPSMGGLPPALESLALAEFET